MEAFGTGGGCLWWATTGETDASGAEEDPYLLWTPIKTGWMDRHPTADREREGMGATTA